MREGDLGAAGAGTQYASASSAALVGVTKTDETRITHGTKPYKKESYGLRWVLPRNRVNRTMYRPTRCAGVEVGVECLNRQQQRAAEESPTALASSLGSRVIGRSRSIDHVFEGVSDRRWGFGDPAQPIYYTE
jgi:hypothetical protein